jgi:hypothetical protein
VYEFIKKGCMSVAVTQPRRVAAMSIARRVAEEMGTEVRLYLIPLLTLCTPQTCNPHLAPLPSWEKLSGTRSGLRTVRVRTHGSST